MLKPQGELLFEHDLHVRYDDMLDDCYGNVTIAGFEHPTSYALKVVDPTAYRCGHDDCPGHALAGYDYCEDHVDHYCCECGQRLEDYYGSPGDGLCRRCD
jgi:hypothetical protein